MSNGWMFARLYVCLLVMSLPLLPASNSQSSSGHVALSSDAAGRPHRGDRDLPAHGHGGLAQIRPDVDQPGSLRLVVDSKRQRFTPWGGKRTLDEVVAWSKRPKFQPWGGKRFARGAAGVPKYANSRMSAYFDTKREFHPWGGK